MPSWTNLNPFSPGQVLTADNMNDLRENVEIGHTVCTSATRPASPASGQMIYETDTSKVLIWNGTAWVDVYPVQPVGSLMAYAGGSAPSGWLLCDGTAVSRTTYADLFSVLSTTYGIGDGSTTFNVPDLRGRVPMGAGTGPGLTTRSRGTTTGTETHTLTEAQIPSHNHSLGPGQSFGTNFGGNAGGVATFGLNVGIINTNTYQGPYVVGYTGGGASHNNVQPSTVVNYIIKA